MEEINNMPEDVLSFSTASAKNGSVEDPMRVDALVDEKSDEAAEEESFEYGELISHVQGFYEKARTKRLPDEQRWLANYRNYRGLYGPDVQFTDTEKSRAFIKITKTKVLASYGKIIDVLFSGNKFPIGVEPTPVPEGIAESVHIDPAAPPKQEKKSEGVRLNTIQRKDIMDNIGGLRDKFEDISADLQEGPGTTPTSQTWEPAKIAARKMDKKIQDQLQEANADKELRAFAFEMCLFGHGIMKGPLVDSVEYPRWDAEGNYKPVFKTVADIVQTSIWNNYPDPAARKDSECEGWVERHRMSKSDLYRLKKRPYFRAARIDKAVEMGPNYTPEWWESHLEDYNTDDGSDSTRYEVLEYWGMIDKSIVEDSEFEEKLPEKYKELDQFQINMWVCNNQVIRLVLNPFHPARIPYFSCPYELNPYSFWGIGVAENMADTQLIMNGFMRLAIDNAVLSSNVVFELDETNLVPGQDMKVYPGKVFRRQGGAPGQALFATKYPNVTNECLLMFDKARQLSDEATGIPSYAHGISGIMSTGRTASGMSMLMGASDQNIKTVVKNIDDYLLHPMGKALFAFNMQFDFDKEIQGDLSVVARGTESLLRNEVRSQKLLQFLQITTNQADAPFVKRDYILRELAETLDLDPEKIVNDPREAALQALQIKELNEAMGVAPQMPQGAGNPAGAPAVTDPTGTGGGNITPGMAPGPQEQGFTGNAPQGVPMNG